MRGTLRYILPLVTLLAAPLALCAEPNKEVSTPTKVIVADQENRPIAGVPVHLYLIRKRQEEYPQFNNRDSLPLLWVSLETTPQTFTTDSKGEFQFEAPTQKDFYLGCAVADDAADNRLARG